MAVFLDGARAKLESVILAFRLQGVCLAKAAETLGL